MPLRLRMSYKTKYSVIKFEKSMIELPFKILVVIQVSLYSHLYGLVGTRASLQWITGEDLPMIKYTLWECLSTSITSQVSGETEGLVYWQVCSYNEHRGSSNLLSTQFV